MQHPTSRPRRVRRVIAISAAAVAVMIAPTACDYGGPAQMDMTGHSGHMDDMNMDDPQEHRVVPVAATSTDPAAEDAAAATDSATARSFSADRRRGDDRRDDRRRGRGYRPVRGTVPAPAGSGATATAGNGADPVATPDPAAPTATDSSAPTAPPAEGTGVVPPGGKDGKNNGLEVLGRDCKNSDLPAHNGFQESPACVSTAMGEVAAEDKLPSLLITKSPKTVGVNQGFQLEISTRNLVRDRFLGAAAGGYYLESSFLDGNGLQRGHFHTACRILPSTNEAPDSSGTPAFFLATQDNGGGASADRVTIDVPGIKTAGELQCTSWAGDGSHRTPMMTRANQTPAIDSVRITVSGEGQPVQDVDQAEAQQDATAQADAQKEEAAQQPDQDGAVPAQPEETANAERPAADDSAADESAVADDSAADETAAAEGSRSRRAGGSDN
jgi:hypothetical protein